MCFEWFSPIKNLLIYIASFFVEWKDRTYRKEKSYITLLDESGGQVFYRKFSDMSKQNLIGTIFKVEFKICHYFEKEKTIKMAKLDFADEEFPEKEVTILHEEQGFYDDNGKHRISLNKNSLNKNMNVFLKTGETKKKKSRF